VCLCVCVCVLLFAEKLDADIATKICV
jgi:hypothetical protein